MNSLRARSEWRQHQLFGPEAKLDMWRWGWIQGSGKLRIPRLGPCIGVMLYDTDQRLAIGGHFPVRNGIPNCSTFLLPTMLGHASSRLCLSASNAWLGGGVLLPENPEFKGLSLEKCEAVNAATLDHRQWVQDTVTQHLGNIPTEARFYDASAEGIHYSIDVATGQPYITVKPRELSKSPPVYMS